jgi:hypothetical protein
MKRPAATIAIITCLFGLSACYDDTSPKGILASAYDALQKNDTKVFTKTLSGRAKRSFGTLDGMIKLQNAMKDYDVTVANVLLRESSREPNGNETKVYDADIVGRPAGVTDATYSRLITAQIACHLYKMRQNMGHCYDGPSGWNPDCDFDGNYAQTVTECRIVGLTID